jgi:TolB-like protein
MAGLFQELKRRNVVRVGVAYIIVGWVAVQIGEVLFDAFGTPDWVIKTVIVLIGLGFPFALLFAWAFELTPEGLKKTQDVDAAASITPKTGQKLNYVIIASLVIALGYFVWERQSLEPAVPTETMADAAVTDPVELPEVVQTARRSIAVLPFVNMSSDQDQEWFADGLTEEILNSLAKAPDLLVAARTSSFVYKGSAEPITQIASELGVDHVLEGSVRRGGDTMRVTAQLIRAIDGFHMWSETFDRTPEDIIAIQEEIAVEIANALDTAMDPEALAEMMEVGTGSVPAYEALLTGRGAFQATGESGDPYVALQALESFERAIELDPEFASAYEALSFFWTLQAASNQLISGITDLPKVERLRRRDEALDKAIEFEDDPVDLLNLRADHAWNALDYQRALRLKKEVVEKRPNNEFSFNGLVNLHRDMGRHKEATALVRHRFENYELTRPLANMAVQSVRTVEDAEFMRIMANAVAEKFPDDVLIQYQVHRQLLWAGDIDGASRILPKVLNSDLPEVNRYLSELRQLCAEQRVADANRLHQAGIEKYPDDIAIQWLGYAIVGDEDSAQSVFDEYDVALDFDELSTYLSYAHFDTSPYPNFMKKLAGQGMDQREILELPYRCNR